MIVRTGSFTDRLLMKVSLRFGRYENIRVGESYDRFRQFTLFPKDHVNELDGPYPSDDPEWCYACTDLIEPGEARVDRLVELSDPETGPMPSDLTEVSVHLRCKDKELP